MAKPAMKLLRHLSAGFGPRTRCCEKRNDGEPAMFVLSRIKIARRDRNVGIVGVTSSVRRDTLQFG